MGHLVNPLSLRLYNIKYWTSNWFTKNQASFLNIQDILLKKLIQRLLLIFFGNSNGILFSHIKLLRLYDTNSIYIFLQDTFFDIIIYNLNRNRKILKLKKFILWRNNFKLFNLKLKNKNNIRFLIIKQFRFLIVQYLKKKFLSNF
jgi:hypothetical protein